MQFINEREKKANILIDYCMGKSDSIRVNVVVVVVVVVIVIVVVVVVVVVIVVDNSP